MGKVRLSSHDPIADIDPLMEPEIRTSVGQRILGEEELTSIGFLIGSDDTGRSGDDYNNEWIVEEQGLHCTKNFFDIFVDEDEDM